MSFTPTRILIGSATLVSDTAIVTFENISQRYDDLEFYISARAGSGSSGGGSVRAQLGGGSYSQRTAYGAGISGTFGASGTTTDFIRVASSVNPGDAAGYSVDRTILFNYSSASVNKTAWARAAQPNFGSSAASFHLDTQSTWYSSAPVTRITFQRDGLGTFAAGSRFQIYGIGR